MTKTLRITIPAFLLPLALWAEGVRIDAPGLRVLVDDRMHTELAGLGPMSASETVTVQGRVVSDFKLRNHRSRKMADKLGKGREHVLTGESDGLRKQVTFAAYDAFSGFLVLQARYTNTGPAPIEVEGWTNHHYALPSKGEGEPAFWSFQSGSYSKRPAWVLPLKAGFKQDNFQGMNSTDYGGGTPVSDVWRRDAGIAVGHLDLKPKLVSLPVTMPDAARAEVRVDYKSPRTLAPGESLDTLRTFVAVHKGDYFSVLANYRKMMIAQGVRLPDSPPSAFEPIWCAWGYRRNFQPSQIYSALPIVKSLGFQWVTLDDGWQTAEGDWHLEKTKFPQGDTDMKAMVDRIHQDGFKAQLWWAPMSVDPGTDLIANHPDWLLLDADGSRHKITYWNAFYLCPAVPEVRQNAADFVTKFIRDWGYDGLKLDGQYMNAAPPCHNPAHGHADPNESVEAAPLFFKAIFDAAIAAKKDAVVEFCPCGTSYSFFTLPYQNMAVASDPHDSWQIRTKGKSLKALMGDRIAYFGDHVELSDEREDFASSVGIGAVIGTEFTWPVGSGPAGRDGQRRNDLTPERQQKWSKWIDIYKAKMLSQGEYLGSLYDIGFDLPETHAIRKDGKMYYSFFAKTFGGKVELRGLEKRKYKVRDYVNGRDLGVVAGPVAPLEVNFLKHLLLEATPE
jgi:alpha-galactosidase